MKNPCKGKTGRRLLICRHHMYLDEMLDNSKKDMHKLLDDSYKTGALPEHFKEDNYLLPKAIITVWCRKEPYAPFSPIGEREVKNLERFI